MLVAFDAVGSRSGSRPPSASSAGIRRGCSDGGLERTAVWLRGCTWGAGSTAADGTGSTVVIACPSPLSGPTVRVSPCPLPDAGVRYRVGIVGRCFVDDPPSAYPTVVAGPSRVRSLDVCGGRKISNLRIGRSRLRCGA